jgi:hypothetical protein
MNPTRQRTPEQTERRADYSARESREGGVSTLNFDMSAALTLPEQAEIISAARDMGDEELAAFVSKTYISAFNTLRGAEPYIRELHERFLKLKFGQSICGCTSWKGFCETVLNRSDRAVRYMLAGGNPSNNKAKIYGSLSRESVKKLEELDVPFHGAQPKDIVEGKASTTGLYRDAWSDEQMRAVNRAQHALSELRDLTFHSPHDTQPATYAASLRKIADSIIKAGNRMVVNEDATDEDEDQPEEFQEYYQKGYVPPPSDEPPLRDLLRSSASDAVLRAATEIIKEGRRTLAMKHHPDKGGNAEDMAVVNQAEQWLKDLMRKEAA